MKLNSPKPSPIVVAKRGFLQLLPRSIATLLFVAALSALGACCWGNPRRGFPYPRVGVVGWLLPVTAVGGWWGGCPRGRGPDSPSSFLGAGVEGFVVLNAVAEVIQRDV